MNMNTNTAPAVSRALTLADSWSVCGKEDWNALYSVLDKLTNATHLLPVSSENIGLVTVRQWDDPNTKRTLMGIKSQYGTSKTWTMTALELRNKLGANDDLLKETVDSSNLLLYVGECCMFTSRHILQTLVQRAGSAMGKLALRDEFIVRFPRDASYVAYLYVDESECQVMYRQIGEAKKAFSIFGRSYKLFPQKDIVKKLVEDFSKEMGTPVLSAYYVDHFYTDVEIEFPEKAADFKNVYNLPNEVVPGIRIYMSDTGDASLQINGTIRLGNATVYVPGAKYTKIHSKGTDFDEMYEFIGQHVFGEYTKVPDRLLELLQIKVANPIECIDDVIKYCDLKKEISPEKMKLFVEKLHNSVNPGLPYTAYDIAMLILEEGPELEKSGPKSKKNDKSTDLFSQSKNPERLSRVRSNLMRAVFYNY